MNIFGYFQLGLRAMDAARLGLQVAGDNIANASTPGYARRRLELAPGFPVRMPGGLIDDGVDVAGLRRLEDRFLQANLEREQGRMAGGEERLRGLRAIESLFGSLGSDGIESALAEFSQAFDQLAGQPENAALRRGAVSAAEGLARSIRSTYTRLQERRRFEDQTVAATVEQVNTLSKELARLNREIAAEESGGAVAAPFRDRRDQIIGELSELTGGTAAQGATGRLSFSLPGGPTLVTGDDAIGLTTSRAADGTLRVHSGATGADITDRTRNGRLGALLYVRDETLVNQLTGLDTLAGDLITRANAIVGGSSDLQGNPGIPLFSSVRVLRPGVAGRIVVNPTLVQDPSRLAVSASGAPGDGAAALALAALPEQASAGLGNRSLLGFVTDSRALLGGEIAQTDITHGVARDLVQVLEARRDAVSGVSLDEEAAELIRNQRAFEAAARFMTVMNEITAVAVSLGER